MKYVFIILFTLVTCAHRAFSLTVNCVDESDSSETEVKNTNSNYGDYKPTYCQDTKVGKYRRIKKTDKPRPMKKSKSNGISNKPDFECN